MTLDDATDRPSESTDRAAPPTRRGLLRAAGVSLAAGLAGCSGLQGGEGSLADGPGPTASATPTDAGTPTGAGTPAETSTPTDHATDRQTDTSTPENGTPAPDLCVKVFGTSPPSEAPVRYALAVEQPTTDRPPVLRTRITNTGDETVLLGEQRAVQHHDGIRSADDALVLLDPGLVAATGSGDCWELTTVAGRTTEYAVLELAPGETATSRSYVLGVERDSGPCLPTGLHPVRPRVFWSGEGEIPDAEDGRPIDWSFVLGIGDGPAYCPVTAGE
jgi:hypothetical protein